MKSIFFFKRKRSWRRNILRIVLFLKGVGGRGLLGNNGKRIFDVVEEFFECSKTVSELDENMDIIRNFYRVRREHLEVLEANEKGLKVFYVGLK